MYQLSLNGTICWLKFQLAGVNRSSEQAFLNEINCYRHFGELTVEMVLPFEIINLNSCFGFSDQMVEQALLVRHADQLFDISPEQLDWDQLLDRLLKSLDALQQLHDAGYLHGDLKTAHFRMYDQQCYLIDLEQCMPQAQSDVDLSSGHSATPRYMAPELFHGRQKSIQSDIYALGLIWLQWLNGQGLQERSYMDWADLHCQQLEVSLALAFRPLESTLRSMLSRVKARRSMNIHQIKQSLSRIL
ncbi:protein kinase domain-containing protein [Acinetobacter sp. WZC-1]|uniref:protein kinase domain-containing protein n=1 Tax=Acinetobacter sp. WZC-1 TaxID=3459034 RepID=UPI00403DF0A8